MTSRPTRPKSGRAAGPRRGSPWKKSAEHWSSVVVTACETAAGCLLAARAAAGAAVDAAEAEADAVAVPAVAAVPTVRTAARAEARRLIRRMQASLSSEDVCSDDRSLIPAGWQGPGP